MQGRYGIDDLSLTTAVFSLIMLSVSFVLSSAALYAVSLFLYTSALLRCFSKQYNKRYHELCVYYRLTAPIKNQLSLSKKRFCDRKTHRYYKCKTCRTVLRVPKGRGKIKITCSKCGNQFIKRT